MCEYVTGKKRKRIDRKKDRKAQVSAFLFNSEAQLFVFNLEKRVKRAGKERR